MIISEAKDLIWNGTPAIMAIYNGEKVWPKKTATAYRVWIEWDPVKSENVCVDGLYWDNLSMVNSDIVEAEYSDNGTMHHLSSTEIAKMVTQDGSSLQKYCRGITFLTDKTAFTSFSFHTDPYYSPTGTLTVEVYEIYNTGEGSDLVATKTVTQAANTTYTINRGDGV